MGKRGNEKAKARAKIALFIGNHTNKKGQVRVPWTPELEAQLGRENDMGAVSRETSGALRRRQQRDPVPGQAVGH
jgi:hypothetical protein